MMKPPKKKTKLPQSHRPPYSEPEQQKVNQWKSKKTSNASLRYNQAQNGKQITLYCTSDDKNLTDRQKTELQRALLTSATGSASAEFAGLLFSQTIKGFVSSEGHDYACVANAVQDALLSLKPQDEIEGMLISRMLVLHNQYMTFLGKVANPEQTTAGIDLNIARATKLSRLHNETLEALNRYRRKGQQKIIVQHVNVNKGGQAVVGGEFNQGVNRDNDKK